MSAEHTIRAFTFGGFNVTVDDTLGKLTVEHDGTITWDQLFAIKNSVWGVEARAIEVYPAQSDLVDNGSYRHLWRLGAADFYPDLLGPVAYNDKLEARWLKAWTLAGA